MGVWLGPMGSGKLTFFIDGDKATVGTHDKYIYYSDDNGNWEIAFLESCTLVFSKEISIDMFLVGGGQNGQKGTWGGANAGNDNKAGVGGQGGSIITKSIKTTKDTYNLIIGKAGESTSIINLTQSSITAIGGGLEGCIGKAGGKGGKIHINTSEHGMPTNANTEVGDKGTEGDLAFSTSQKDANGQIRNFKDADKDTQIPSFKGTLFGASGGGGGITYYLWNSNSCIYGRDGGQTHKNIDSYPIENYGKGYDWNKTPNSTFTGDGRKNTGQGGGGGSFQGNNNTYDAYTIHDGGPGGSGIIIIRNHRNFA